MFFPCQFISYFPNIFTTCLLLPSSKDRFFKVFPVIYDNLEFIESVLLDFF